MFFILCISVLLVTDGNVKLLAGVYTLSFLSVMVLFGLGNVFLKVKRSKLPRPEKASWATVIIAIFAFLLALIGNINMNPKGDLPSNLTVFMYYFVPAIVFVTVMLNRTLPLKGVLNSINSISDPIRKYIQYVDRGINNTIDYINSQEFVFFKKSDSIATLNKVVLYISKNEHTKRIKIVLVANDNDEYCDDDILVNMACEIEFLGREYPDINIEFVVEKGEFTPELIKELSKNGVFQLISCLLVLQLKNSRIKLGSLVVLG